MELNKKKYTLDEVRKLLSSVEEQYETKLNNQKDRISALLEENEKLEREVSAYKEKDALISSTLISAREKAEEMEKTAALKYSLVLETLKKFSQNWNSYFEFLKDKYPNYATIQKAVKLKELLDEKLSYSDDDESVIKLLKSKLDEETDKLSLLPKGRVSDFIAATSDSGFNLEEVLNPGKLELEDLCKELGLME